MTIKNSKRAIQLVSDLMSIRGPSCEETQVAQFIESYLKEHGLAEAVTYDNAHKKTPRPGAIGNMLVKLPGSAKRPRILLSAHMDSVPLCVGCKPKRQGDQIRSSDKTTALGADDRAGVAAILIGLQEAIESGQPLTPATLCFFVQEEIGLQGSRHLQVAKLGKIDMAFNFDGSSPQKLTIGATGGEKLKVVLHGLASHAGLAPAAGASAIHAAGLAIASLHKDGWLGAVRKGKQVGTSNIGIIQGGAATNVVCDRVEIAAEARSHDSQFRDAIASAMAQAFVQASEKVKSTSGVAVRAEVERRVDYESFRLAEDAPVVQAASSAIKALGGSPTLAISNGGVDANWLVRHGIPTVTLGCGQRDVHTTSEALDIPDYLVACGIVQRLLTLAEGR